MKSSTSDLLIANCDEFIYYDDLVVAAKKRPPLKKKGKKTTDRKQEAAERLLEIVRSLEGDYDPLWGSLVKQTMRRMYPGFNETYYGYRSFSEMLEAVAEMGLLKVDHDQERGNYKVSLAAE